MNNRVYAVYIYVCYVYIYVCVLAWKNIWSISLYL